MRSDYSDKFNARSPHPQTPAAPVITGGDLNATLKATPGQVDTGMIDAEALLDFVKGKTLRNAEARVHVVP